MRRVTARRSCIRGGADYTFANGLIVAPGIRCLRLNSATTMQTAGPDEAGSAEVLLGVDAVQRDAVPRHRAA